MSYLSEQKVKHRNLLSLLLLLSILPAGGLAGCGSASTPRLPSEEQIGRRINSVLELPTYEYVYRDVIYIADQASFLGIRHRDTQLLFAVDVRIQAGINLQRGISVKQDSSGDVDISLPAPEILMVDADESTIHQYFKKEFGGEINRLDYYDEIAAGKQRIIKDAVERGILDRAGQNAESLIHSVLASVAPGEIRVIFREIHDGSGIK